MKDGSLYVTAWALGKRGSGKTTLGRHIADLYCQRCTTCECQIPPKDPVLLRNLRGPFCKCAVPVPGEVWIFDVKGELSPPLHGRYIGVDENTPLTDSGPYFEWCNAWCERAIREAKQRGRGMLLFLDEVDTMIKGQSIPPALLRVIMQGRTLGISYIMMSRIPVELTPNIRSQIEDIYCFLITETLYLKRVESWGFPSDVQCLRRGECYHKRDGLAAPHFHKYALSRCVEV